MRIVSLLASGTEIICGLDAGKALVGRSHECDNPDWVGSLPCCSAPAFDVSLSSREIDREVTRRIRSGEPLYWIDEDRIRSLAPDVIVAQAHCQVCAVTPADLTGASRAQARVVPLSAFTLEDIFAGMMQIAEALGLQDRGQELVRAERARMEAVREAVKGRPRPRTAVLEWTDPLFAMGNWGPELVEVAGGEPVLGNQGQYSTAIGAELLREADPEFLVIAPCGFSLDRAWQERSVMEAMPGWDELRSVREGKVVFADGNRLFNRSGMTVTATAELLAEILHGVGIRKMEESADIRWYTDSRVPIS